MTTQPDRQDACTCGQAGHGNAHEPGCPRSDRPDRQNGEGLRSSYLEMMRAHVDEGGKLSHRNGCDLLAEVERLRATPPASHDGAEGAGQIRSTIYNILNEEITQPRPEYLPAHFNNAVTRLTALFAATPRDAVIEECAKKIGDMRQSEAGLLEPMHSGQRGQDRSNALWDAYQAIRALKDSGTDSLYPKGNEGVGPLTDAQAEEISRRAT